VKTVTLCSSLLDMHLGDVIVQ